MGRGDTRARYLLRALGKNTERFAQVFYSLRVICLDVIAQPRQQPCIIGDMFQCQVGNILNSFDISGRVADGIVQVF